MEKEKSGDADKADKKDDDEEIDENNEEMSIIEKRVLRLLVNKQIRDLKKLKKISN